MNPNQPSQAAKVSTWVQLSPFGNFRGANSVHVFDRGAAAAMVGAFNRAKAGNQIPRGLPVFIGDPDADLKANPDRRKYGSILALEVRADGLYAQARWSKAGRELLANDHFAYIAPHWQTEPLPGKRGGIRPVELVSAGLTNWPPSSDALPLAANTGEPAAPSLSSVHAANTAPHIMNHTPASNAFWQLVYQRMMATQEPQDKAFANCKSMHSETFAAYEKETAASVEATTAANEAASTAKENRVAARQSRIASIKAAVDQELKRVGNDKIDSYSRAYANVQKAKPELFRDLEPDPVAAANEAAIPNLAGSSFGWELADHKRHDSTERAQSNG